MAIITEIMLLGQKFCRKSHGDWIGWASSCWSNWSDLEACKFGCLPLWMGQQNICKIVNHQLKNYQLTIETDYLVAGLARLQVLDENNHRFFSPGKNPTWDLRLRLWLFPRSKVSKVLFWRKASANSSAPGSDFGSRNLKNSGKPTWQ